MPNSSFRSVVEMFHHRVSSTPDAEAMFGRKRNDWYTLTWRDVGDRARRIACGLHALELAAGDRCAILAATRPEWVLADMGILAAAGATTTIYPSNTAAECAYILGNSEAVWAFADSDAQVDKLLEVRDELPALRGIITFDGKSREDGFVLTLKQLERRGKQWDEDHPGRYAEIADAVGPEDLATLIYTSGTTGPPKGVMLSHANWVYEGESIEKIAVLQPADKQYLFLPLAHSFAKVLEIAFIRLGVPTVVDGSLEDLLPNLAATRPTAMGAVPRIFEKVYNRMVGRAKQAGGARYKLFRWAMGVGAEVSKMRLAGREPSGLLAAQHRVADRLVFSKLKQAFGGRVRYFISGGAPLSREIAEFFHAADVLVLEGYGLTESSAATFCNRPEDYRFGTVGKAMPGTEVRIAEDGEILLRGPGIMQGYYKLPDATAEALEDGWLHTGDIGQLDADGFLRITGRKKELIITAGGKNIAPGHVENLLKARSPYVSQVVMHGDQRNFCVALISIDADAVSAWAREQGLRFQTYDELAALPQVHDLIWADVQKLNGELPSYETVKKIALLDHELSVESGELTPTMKVKRRVVEERNAELLDAFYDGAIAAM